MSDRKWCPLDWLDETAPPLLDHPSRATCLLDEAGRWHVVPDKPADRHDFDLVVEPGQLVSWVYHEAFPLVEIELAADGSFSIVDGTVDPRAKFFWMPQEPDAMGDTLADVAHALHGIVDPGRIEIEPYLWSDGEPFRFDVVDGQGRFVLVAGAN